MNPDNYNSLFPPAGYLRWLTTSLTVFQIITGIIAVSGIILPGALGLPFWTNSPIAGVAIILLLISGYWRNYIKGAKPTSEGISEDPLKYFSIAGRNIWWRAIMHAQRDGQALTAKYIFLSLVEHIGVRLSLIRMGLASSEIETVLIADSITPEQIVETAREFAQKENSHISWEDMWRALVMVSPTINKLLEAHDITPEEAVATIDWSRRDLYRSFPKRRMFSDLFTSGRNMNRTWTARPTPTLDQYSRDLTELAKLGLMTSAKVRDAEVSQAIQILSKTSQNNLILVGEPGVGKTSVIGDIALRVIKGDIPALSDYKLVSLDVNAMIGAGDDFQTVFTNAIEEASASGNTILFIGNLDQFGKVHSTTGFDLSAILTSALEHKGLQLIGTSDMTNYKKYIENNSNFSQNFTRLNIEEMSPSASILVLQESAREIEGRQGVIITLAAIKAAVELSAKLIHTSKLPAKAEAILDEAAVWAARNAQQLVTAETVQEIISTKTNVPVGEITADEKDKLAGLATQMTGRVIGQDQAVAAVVSAIQRARLGISASTKRPIGSFLFLGPTGVGKTETAKALAGAYFGDDTKMIRLDMSEFQSRESIYRLIGNPASAGDSALAGGLFTEAVKAAPFSVVLLDEIEKSHPDVLNLFLQVLDEGRLTDSLGNTIDFTHTIIIATSNAQAQYIQEAIAGNTAYEKLQKEVVSRLVQNDFRPELVNRFDGAIVFKPLGMDSIAAIAKLKVNKLIAHLQETKDIQLTVTDAGIQKLAEMGYDPAFGARPLERVIRDQLENFVTRKLLEGAPTELTFDQADIVA